MKEYALRYVNKCRCFQSIRDVARVAIIMSQLWIHHMEWDYKQIPPLTLNIINFMELIIVRLYLP